MSKWTNDAGAAAVSTTRPTAKAAAEVFALGAPVCTARPKICVGCPGDPRTPGHIAALWGAYVPPHGPVGAQLLVVGIAPAEDEERLGEPLVGPSGKKLMTAINWALDGRRLTIRKLNIVNCRTRKPGKSQTWVNRDPTAREFHECAKRFLLPELLRTEARVILLLGQLPFDLVLKPLGLALHRLPRVAHKYTFQLSMGHRVIVPRRFLEEQTK